MAKQFGTHYLIGTVGDITYYRASDKGLLARRKSSLDKERVETDPAFEKSRKASTEFGRASLAAGLARSTMEIAGHTLNDTKIYSRLTGLFIRAIATDMMHVKGERTLAGADLNVLLGFEWNQHKAFGKLYRGQPSFSIDAQRGLMEIDLPGIDSAKEFDAPDYATHVQLTLEGAGFDFHSGMGVCTTDSTEWLDLKQKHRVHNLSGTVSVWAGIRMVLGLGIQFGQEVNGVVAALNDRNYKGFVVGAVV